MRMDSEIRIFLFHLVTESKENWIHATDTSIFEKCIRYIAQNFSVTTVEESLAMQGEKSAHATKPPACITFDDGFKDNIKYALPILEKYKCKASFYIATDCIDNDLPTWPHQFNNLFQNTHKSALSISSKYMGAAVEKKFASKKERVAYGEKMLQKLFAMPSCDAIKVLEEVKQNFNDVAEPKNMMMSWKDVKQLCAAGYTVGSHTCSHPMLTRLTDEKMKHEFTHSAARIKELCGKSPEVIAYPSGVTDERVMRIAKESGYKYGLTVEQRFYKPAVDSKMAIPRVDMYADAGWAKTYLRLMGVLK